MSEEEDIVVEHIVGYTLSIGFILVFFCIVIGTFVYSCYSGIFAVKTSARAQQMIQLGKTQERTNY